MVALEARPPAWGAQSSVLLPGLFAEHSEFRARAGLWEEEEDFSFGAWKESQRAAPFFPNACAHRSLQEGKAGRERREPGEPTGHTDRGAPWGRGAA